MFFVVVFGCGRYTTENQRPRSYGTIYTGYALNMYRARARRCVAFLIAAVRW